MIFDHASIKIATWRSKKRSLFPIAVLGLLALMALPLIILAGAARQEKPRTVEEIVERALLAYGGRPAIYAVQRNGVIRANIKLIGADGVREGRMISRFIRKPKLGEDLVTIELDLPELKYTITSDGKDLWSTENGLPHKPSEQEIRGFRGSHEHYYEALLRYKENESTIEYTGSNKIGTLDLDKIRLTSKQGVVTTYEISRRTGRILYVNYDEQADQASPVVRYRLYFKDFRVIQNTVIPYEIQVFQNGKLIEERKIVEAVFNVQMEEKIFKSTTTAKVDDPK
ncbi:MAG: hypothetical protein EBU88_07875 [Acidobacteria bacterium]|nr:hypothetical protein [Acidobacteriota bacterium]